jgi:hypothetical protein
MELGDEAIDLLVLASELFPQEGGIQTAGYLFVNN